MIHKIKVSTQLEFENTESIEETKNRLTSWIVDGLKDNSLEEVFDVEIEEIK